jgi:hypothetical protein
MEIGKSYCFAMSVDADRFSDAYIRKHILPCIKPTFEHPELFRRACRELRELGYKVFPPCDKAGPTGECMGHEKPTAKGET